MPNYVLNFFDKLDGKRAKCVFCSDIIDYTRPHKLANHMKIKHSDSIDWALILQSENSNRKRRKFSGNGTKKHVWANFTKTDVQQKLAKCNICEKILSHKSTIANLRLHLKRKHAEVFANYESPREIDENDQEEPGPSDTSGVWGSFEKQSNNTSSSNHRLNKNEEIHSDVDEQNCYTEVVYLEDEEQTSKKPEPIIEVPRPQTEPKETQISFEPMETENEEIENFSKYVTSLLKKLPKDLCTQLQMDIINLIMTAKLNKMGKHLAPNLTAANVGNASYLLLPNVPVGNPSEGLKTFNRDPSLPTL
ncbi:uncharacterized protein LOC125074681 [Vanessa atalanta]|uniref:uncharacterized protein LOC125074681 n=1 Tax=Vanessa atalanta TaxID=42275 RepID=UPI001FCD7D40|nr:uncharacterized protein LOC125074681 [Vanessa atalanta]